MKFSLSCADSSSILASRDFPVFPFSRFLILSVVVILFIPHASAQIVEIPDPNLRQAIRETLQLPDSVPITQQEMGLLREFEAEQRGITDLTGLEFATNAINLLLSGNRISDLSPLSGLKGLRNLWLTRNSIDSSLDISPLSNLTDLKVLAIGHCRISDLTPLANLTQLHGLILTENGIRDITPLAGLVNLGFLTLIENRVADLAPLANFTQLEDLTIIGCRITDITALADLTNLVTLNLASNQIVDISALAGLTQLEKLVMDSNQVVDISPLANLTRLKELKIDRNRIVDFNPLQGLMLTNLRYDEVCELPDPPVQDRIQNRNRPSIAQAFDNTIVNLPALSYLDRIAYHDLWWQHLPFDLRFQQTLPWYHLVGDIDRAVAQREELLARNPNMLFLVEIRVRHANPAFHYPEDWFGWLRDENGNLIKTTPNPLSRHYFIDFRLPEVQDIIVQQAISVAQCGLYDGIFFDSWSDAGPVLVSFDDVPDSERQYYSTFEEEIAARLSIVQRIRANVPDDFLILCNSNWAKLPITGPYINGVWVETFRDAGGVYLNTTLAQIEDSLSWYEGNLREPQITALRGEGIPTEPPDSPNNRRWMRLFTTMSLTLSEGYALYTVGGRDQHQNHIWYDFWDADLGQPIGPQAQRYQDIEGLYIREFTNGWAVYNRSGKAQTITLPSSAAAVGNGDLRSKTTHQLPNLDGEIYLKAPNSADVNGDGKVNILDLVQVANGLGKAAPDPNGDGAVNILDLVFVAQQFSQ